MTPPANRSSAPQSSRTASTARRTAPSCARPAWPTRTWPSRSSASSASTARTRRARCRSGRRPTPRDSASRPAQGVAVPFTTISVSDGVSMNHRGMRMSLVSRELIADSIEAVMAAHAYDALVGFAGCDKTLPGMMMAMVRLNVPSVFVYGGAMLPGHWRGKDVTILTTYEGVGSVLAGHMTEAELDELGHACAPTLGSCPGPVHRQHDGDGRRDARPRAARLGDAAGGLHRAARAGAPRRPARDRDRARTAGRCRATSSRASRSRTPAPRSPRPAARPTPACTCRRSRTRPASASRSTTSPRCSRARR